MLTKLDSRDADGDASPVRSPYRTQVFVCVDPWEGGCERKGSRDILTRFRRECRDRGLRLEVRATGTYCLGGCSLGPNLVMHPDGVWYQSVGQDDVPEMIDRHLLGGRAVDRLLRRDHHLGQAGALPLTAPASVAAGAAGAAAAPFPRTLLDGLERSVTVPARPACVAAVGAGATAIVRHLALAEALPFDSVLAAATAGRPALILADHDAPPESLGAAESAGVPLVSLSKPEYIYYIQTNIGLAARAMGIEERAATVNAVIDTQVESYRVVAEGAGRRTRAVYYTPGETTAGPYSFIATLIYGAAGENPVEAVGPGQDDRVPLSIEGLARLEPDVILLGEPEEAPTGLRDALLGDPRLANTPAVRTGRLHWLDLRPYGDRLRSHEVMDAVADVHRLLYPQPAG